MPAEWRRARIALGWGDLSWVECGAGPPLVLLHGAGFDEAWLSWSLVAPHLSAGRRVLIPDLPGYGQSAAGPGDGGLSALAQAVAVWMRAIDVPRADLGGVSMGGGIALWLAIHDPDLVASLSLLAPYGLMRRSPLHLAGLALRNRRIARWSYEMTRRHPRRALRRVAVRDDRLIDDDLVARFAQSAARLKTSHSLDRFLAAELSATGMRSVLNDRLAEISAPVLLIHGRSDRVIPISGARRAATLIPGAQFAAFAGRHLPSLEHPVAIAALMAAHIGAPAPMAH